MSVHACLCMSGFQDTLPVCVVRPSIVCPSWREPYPGWTDTFNGPPVRKAKEKLGEGKWERRERRFAGRFHTQVERERAAEIEREIEREMRGRGRQGYSGNDSSPGWTDAFNAFNAFNRPQLFLTFLA